MLDCGIFRAVWKGRGGGQELSADVIRAPVWGNWYPPFLCYTKDFACRSGVILNPCISATNENFEIFFLILGITNDSKTLQTSAMNRSTEVARPSNRYFRFYLQKWGKFEPFYLINESRFWKSKESAFSLWYRPNNRYFWFYVQKWDNFEPLYLSNEWRFWKIKKCF